MKIRTSIFAVILVLFFIVWAGPSHAVVEISGYINGDTTWTNLETIMVTGSVTVTSSNSLVIEAGATVLFASGTGLYVYGELTGDGASNQRIVFTSSADTAGGTPIAGSWYGVRFQANSEGLLLNCDLRYAEYCVYAYKSSPEFNRCTMNNFLKAGVYINGFTSYPLITPSIRNCVIDQSEPSLIGTGVGILVYQSVQATISGCKISNCNHGLEFLANRTITPHFQVSNCEIRDNDSTGIYCRAGG